MQLDGYDLVPYIRSAENAVRKPFFIGERTLLDYALLYVQEGTMRVALTRRNEVHHVQKGQFCLLQPGDVHILEGLTDTISPYVHLDLFYNPQRVRSFVTLPGQVAVPEQALLMQPRLADMHGFRVPLAFEPANKPLFLATLMTVIDAWQSGSCGLQNRLKAHGAALQLIFQLLEPYAEPEPVSAKRHMDLNWVTSYFELHLSAPLRVDDMAKRANLSVPRFNVVFRETFGQSPYQYFLAMKLRHAKELLRTSALSMREIADYCGFSDIHHFVSTFKRKSGTTPGRYRNGADEKGSEGGAGK